jgi:hypothetical protein
MCEDSTHMSWPSSCKSGQVALAPPVQHRSNDPRPTHHTCVLGSFRAGVSQVPGQLSALLALLQRAGHDG